MELHAIEMDREQAKARFEEYAVAVKHGRDEEDRAIAEGYKALSEGKRLIRLSETIKAGGTSTVDVPGLFGRSSAVVTVPNIAFVRAGAKIAHTEGVDTDGGCLITADRKSRDLHLQNRRDRFVVPDGTFAGEVARNTWGYYVRAIVPNIPPGLRPRRGLHLYTILWEAEWAPDPVPPVDPALLRRLGGDLYVLCGTWDLTDLERSVLAGRL